jgi:predicted nucleic acid-binding protein
VILVDTSVWVDHLRAGDKALAARLEAGAVLTHPFVIGELALGNLRQRKIVLDALSDLPRTNVANDAEVLHFIDQHGLFGLGIGYVDAHLLAAARLTAGAELWTNDKRLHGVADKLRLAVTRSLRHGVADKLSLAVTRSLRPGS